MRYHTTDNGNIPFTEEEEALWDAREAVVLQEESRAATIKKIVALELTITGRLMREAIMGVATAKSKISSIESQIATLRKSL